MAADLTRLVSWLKPSFKARPQKRQLLCEQLEDRLTPVLGGYEILPLVQEPFSLMPGSTTDNFAGVVNYAESCTGALIDRNGDVVPLPGAQLVGSQYIILAAHCIPLVGDDVTFYLPAAPEGIPDGTIKAITIKVASVWVHPDYDPGTSDSDIAVVTLASLAPHGATAYQLYSNTDEAGQNFVMSGYGRTGTGTSGQSNEVEIQRMTITATTGRFFIRSAGVTGTVSLGFNATAAEIDGAIEALASIGSVRVTRIAEGPFVGSFEIIWNNPGGNQPQLQFVSATGANVLRNGAAAGVVNFATLFNGDDTEYQRIVHNGVGGTFRLAAETPTGTLQTDPIAFNATALQVQNAINAIAGLGPITVYKPSAGNYVLQYDLNGDFEHIQFLADPTFVGTGSVNTIQDGGVRTFRFGTNRYDSVNPNTSHLDSDFDENTDDEFEGQGDSGGAGFIDVGNGDYAIASVVSFGGLFFGDPESNTRVSDFIAEIQAVIAPTSYDFTLDMTKQVVGGDELANTITLQEVNGFVEVYVDGTLYFRDTATSIASIRLIGSTDDDTFILSGPLSNVVFTIDGGGGIDTLPIIGDDRDDSYSIYNAGNSNGVIVGSFARFNYSSVEVTVFDAAGGINSLGWIDESNLAYGSATTPGSGIVYIPTGAASGVVRIADAASVYTFANINGGFAMSGDSNGSGDRDTLTVLAPSEGGAQSEFFEFAAGTGVDNIVVSDQFVLISNESFGAFRSVVFDSSFSSVIVRGGNELGAVGDVFTVTPSTIINILVDGMGPRARGPGDRLFVNSTGPTDTAPGDPTLGGPHNRFIRLSDRANFGFRGFEDSTDSSIIAVATEAGVAGDVRGLEPSTGEVRWSSRPFGAFAGGLRVAVGDVNGDGIDDVIVGAGPGAGPRVVVLNGGDGSEISSFFAFAPTFDGGVTVSSADLNNDGFDDIIVGADTRGNSHVKVIDGRTGQDLRSFFAFNGFQFGVRVAGGDVNGDGFADILVAAGQGSTPVFRIFDGASGALLQESVAFAADFTGGINIASGDVDGDGFADTIIGAGRAGNPHVKVYSGLSGVEIASFFVNEEFSPTSLSSVPFEAGVAVAAGDLDGDGIDEILTSRGRGSRSILRGFRLAQRDAFGNTVPTGLIPVSSINVYPGFFGGFSVGG